MCFFLHLPCCFIYLNSPSKALEVILTLWTTNVFVCVCLPFYPAGQKARVTIV